MIIYNREICGHCMYSIPRQKFCDEDSYKSMFSAYCPVAAHATKVLPDACPYILEHVVSQPQEDDYVI